MLSQAEKDLKFSAFTRYASNLQTASVRLNDLAGDRKPKSRSCGLVGNEGIEYIFYLAVCHSASVVTDGNTDAVSNSGCRNRDNAVRVLNGFLGISEKVQKRLMDFCLVQTKKGKGLGNICFQSDPKVVQRRAERADNTF